MVDAKESLDLKALKEDLDLVVLLALRALLALLALAQNQDDPDLLDHQVIQDQLAIE